MCCFAGVGYRIVTYFLKLILYSVYKLVREKNISLREICFEPGEKLFCFSENCFNLILMENNYAYKFYEKTFITCRSRIRHEKNLRNREESLPKTLTGPACSKPF